jgi:sulfur carrier protein ThiS
MKFSVKLVGALRVGRFTEKFLDYPDNTKVEKVVADLDLPENMLGIVLINGLHASEQSILKEGDALVLLPLLGGG